MTLPLQQSLHMGAERCRTHGSDVEEGACIVQALKSALNMQAPRAQLCCSPCRCQCHTARQTCRGSHTARSPNRCRTVTRSRTAAPLPSQTCSTSCTLLHRQRIQWTFLRTWMMQVGPLCCTLLYGRHCSCFCALVVHCHAQSRGEGLHILVKPTLQAPPAECLSNLGCEDGSLMWW